jgi:hypothetical protein
MKIAARAPTTMVTPTSWASETPASATKKA